LGLKGTEPNKGMFISQICQNLDELGKGILRSLPHAKEKNTCKFKGNLVEQKGFEPSTPTLRT
jgi:hypothetical protein